MFNRDKIPTEILPGSVFECSHRSFNSVEVAEVLNRKSLAKGLEQLAQV